MMNRIKALKIGMKQRFDTKIDASWEVREYDLARSSADQQVVGWS